MTISTIPSATTILGNGVLTSFQFFFIGVAAADITVTYVDATGAQTVLTSAQYSLTLNAATTGSLWGIGGTCVYPTSGSPIAAGTSLIISRTLPLTQLTTISNQGQFTPQVIEQALDLLCLEIQQVSGRTGQIRGTWATGITYNYGDIVQDGTNGLNTLNYYLCAIENTSGTWSTDLAAGDWSLAINVQQIEGFATAAAASAAAAALSATAAAGSASAAAGSASTATTQAGIATTQAGIATTQAGNAATSATNSANSASAAAGSATSASSSATTATTQAGIATTQAGNSATSATSSANSATSSATSATNAANSATAAAASAVLAGSALTATSTTSNTIGTGNFTFTIQANKNFFAGQNIIAASNANSSNYIHGTVFSYSGTTLVITETDNGGSGAHADWNISVSGTQGTSGAGSGTVNSGTSGQVTYYGATGTTVSGNPNLTVSSGAVTHGQTGSVQGSLILAGSTSGTTTLAAPVAGTGTMTLQAGTDTLVGRATTDTLTNKTLTAPVISTITNTGTLTLPTSTDTLVGRATTDTLTHKTYDTAGTGNIFKINGTTVSSISGNTSTVATTSGTLTTGATAVFDASGNIIAGAGGAIQVLNIQTFTSSGTYTPTAGMLYAYIYTVGGGGGGGSSAAISGSAGSGGGSGQVVPTLVTAATIGSSISVTIGAGGIISTNGSQTFLGSSTLIAQGGGAGITATGLGINQGGAIGFGGAQPGLPGLGISASATCGGDGGGNAFGVVGQGGKNAVGNTGTLGTGGGGGSTTSATVRAGATGASGYVYIIEYCT